MLMPLEKFVGFAACNNNKDYSYRTVPGNVVGDELEASGTGEGYF